MLNLGYQEENGQIVSCLYFQRQKLFYILMKSHYNIMGTVWNIDKLLPPDSEPHKTLKANTKTVYLEGIIQKLYGKYYEYFRYANLINPGKLEFYINLGR